MYRTGHGRARAKASLTNKISTYGIMAGLAPKTGRPKYLSDYINSRSVGTLEIPLRPLEGLMYMEGNNPTRKYLLSKNPVGSGGVGKMMPNMRCCGSGTMSTLRPKMVNTVNVNNSNTGYILNSVAEARLINKVRAESQGRYFGHSLTATTTDTDLMDEYQGSYM